jgi:HEAT repeat protein
MGSVFNTIAHLSAARMLFGAIAGSLGGIALLLAYIVGRRWLRGRYFRRRDAIAGWIRQHWDELVLGSLPAEHWARDKLKRSVLEAILLDRLEVAEERELQELIECLRRSGILDERITQARGSSGWKRRAALVKLGRTRAPEALPALSEALESEDMETRIAAVRGLGKLGTAAAAERMLRRIEGEGLDVPLNVVKNALLNSCASDPGVLVRHMEAGDPGRRAMLARVLSEVADAATWGDLVIMAGDVSAEVRGSAARGLARATPEIALAPLAQLSGDAEWFVRLRAVVALGSFVDEGALPVLIKLLGDRNRLVRQRAAWALIRSKELASKVLAAAVRAGDNYGLQALVSELDRSGLYKPLVEKLRQQGGDRNSLLEALERAHARLAPGYDVATRKSEAVPV